MIHWICHFHIGVAEHLAVSTLLDPWNYTKNVGILWVFCYHRTDDSVVDYLHSSSGRKTFSHHDTYYPSKVVDYFYLAGVNNPNHNCFDSIVHSHLVGHLPVDNHCIQRFVDNRLYNNLADYYLTDNDHHPKIGPTDSDPQSDQLGIVSILSVPQLY